MKKNATVRRRLSARSRSKSRSGPLVSGRRPQKYVYFFGNGRADGNRTMRALLGGKGAGLAEIINAGLPSPPGFTISTEACRAFYENRCKTPRVIDLEMCTHVSKLEKAAGAKLGSGKRPLLVAVRSGAAFSMPGMMDTILNLGLNDETVEGLKTRTANGRFAFDSYRRLLQMFGSVVFGISKETFESTLDSVKAERGARRDTDLDEAALRVVVAQYKEIIRCKSGQTFPQATRTQLRMARDAVFRSWKNPRAVEYRRIYSIPDDMGTAVNIQAMVFGNTGNRSATGVGFTRNPATGAKEFYGEFLINAQGEDVVAGVRTPQSLGELARVLPRAHKQLCRIARRLEQHYKDAQDFEFTIQDDQLFMLQSRSAKRTGYASVVIATDMVTERMLKPVEALMRVDADALSQLLTPVFDPQAWAALPVLTRGLSASPGAASGQAVFTVNDAVAAARAGKAVVLVRKETVPDDVRGMYVSCGVLTATGGITSHAAVVGRQMGKPAVVGAEELRIDVARRMMRVGGRSVHEGDYISLNGATGEIKLGEVVTVPSEVLRVVSGELDSKRSDIYRRFSRLLRWADEVRRLGVRANADLPGQAELAYDFGARGIGLCRTEHMFFGVKRIPIVQRMILAETERERRAALDELLPLQRGDFYGVFKAMHGQAVTIRLIDPPLHEFLPKREQLMVDITRLEISNSDSDELEHKRVLLKRVDQLHEFNPMMGHRGVRLTISYPEIAEMQTRAIIQAASKLIKEGKRIVPEIMVPLVGHVQELRELKSVIDRVSAETMHSEGVKVKYLVGTMIEIPRGAITADEIASEAQFFSFGTNDLTQMTFGFSRDDSGKFLDVYKNRNILKRDPFSSIDVGGVGELVKIAVAKGRRTNPNLKLGVCGEHGGDPASIHFFERAGLDYVSASPYRIPTARLAAAQAVLCLNRDAKH